MFLKGNRGYVDLGEKVGEKGMTEKKGRRGNYVRDIIYEGKKEFMQPSAFSHNGAWCK